MPLEVATVQRHEPEYLRSPESPRAATREAGRPCSRNACKNPRGSDRRLSSRPKPRRPLSLRPGRGARRLSQFSDGSQVYVPDGNALIIGCCESSKDAISGAGFDETRKKSHPL